MRLSQLTQKLFIKNKFLSGVTLVYLAGVTGYFSRLFYILFVTQKGADFGAAPLNTSLELCMLSFVLFTFISYEYCYTARRSNADEWLRSLAGGYPRLIRSQVSFLALLSFLFFLFQTALLILPTLINSGWMGEYFLHAVMTLFVYHFMTACAGVLLGTFCALILPRLAAYLILLLFVFFSTSFFERVLYSLPERWMTTGVQVQQFFHIFPVNLDNGFNSHYGYSLLPCQVDAVLFWGLLFLSGVLLFFAKKRGAIKARSLCALCFAGCLTCLVLYAQPSSRMDRTSNAVSGFLVDYNYYVEQGNDQQQKTQAADFKITDYKLKLDIYRHLKADAQLCVSEPDLEAYRFTLYHGYQVQSVHNQAGEALSFSQEGDYITVQAGAAATQTLRLRYSGVAARYASNTQFTWLPGFFAYYPRAGFEPLYYHEGDNFAMERLIPAEDAWFEVQVNTLRKLYSNLEQTGKNTFSGNADTVTFVSGLLKEITCDGVTVVYPYLAYPEEWIRTELAAAKDKGFLPDRVKRILFSPFLDQAVPSEYSAFYKDYADLNAFSYDRDNYYAVLVSNEKKPLANMLYWYEEQSQFYAAYLEKEKGRTEKDASTYYLQFDKKIMALGEEAFLTRCNTYLEDTNDQRSIQEFFDAIPDDPQRTGYTTDERLPSDPELRKSATSNASMQ